MPPAAATPFELDPRHDAWIRSHAEVVAPIERPAPYPWSIVLRVRARDGVLWFKENIPPLAFEARTTKLLVRRRADLLVELVAVDAEQGWLLMRDAGTRLAERTASLGDWERVLGLYAQLQLDVAPDADALLAADCPDRRLRTLPAQLARLVEAEPRLTTAEAERLRQLVPAVEAAAAELAALGVPETIQHDDLHGGNVFVRDGRIRLLDWGDSGVSHPFGSLTIPLEVLAETTDWPLTRLRDAYLEPFGALAPPSELRRAVAAALLVGRVTRALKWAPIVAALTRPNQLEDVVAHRLRTLLEPSALDRL